jgi:hypothetical protein
MLATWTSKTALAFVRSLLDLLRHWQYPERDTPSERHSRATGNVSRYDSIQVRRRFFYDFKIHPGVGQLPA